MDNSKIMFRYIVNDTERAMRFYEENLDFRVDMHPAPGFAALSRGNLRLFLNQPGAGGAGQKMPDGTAPEPGGWNRIQINVDNAETMYRKLKDKGAEFRSGIIEGIGGKQILLKDPSGNLIELFEAKQNGQPNYIPEGYHTITPFIATDQPYEVIQFIESAFKGEVNSSMNSDDGILRHATIRIGDSLIMISNGTDLYEATPLMLHVYVENVDETYRHALKAGSISTQEPRDEFYGDRRAGVKDKWNNRWWIATHLKDLSANEIKMRESEFRKQTKT